MDVFEIYPRQVNPVLFEEAYNLHEAARATYRNSHPKGDQGQPVAMHAASAQQQQRANILRIAAQLMILKRNELLDLFCVEWLKYRDIPIPEKENASSPSPVGVQGSEGPDGRVRPESGTDSGGPSTLHSQSTSSTTQPTGGQSIP